MNNLDKYYDSPCYNCIVRASCRIPCNIPVSVHYDLKVNPDNRLEFKCNNEPTKYSVDLLRCCCPDLYDYLKEKSDKSIYDILLNLRSFYR